MNCTRCDGSGLLNMEQLDEELSDALSVDADRDGADGILDAIELHPEVEHDISICDCCGDGGCWHGTPGQHYGPLDPPGDSGPYADNGGLCACH
jgi:hypothetical protein